MTQLPDQQPDASRRAFVTRAAYMAPAILTLAAAPSYAKAGSEKPAVGPTDSETETALPTGSGRQDLRRPRRPTTEKVARPPV
jgi:hypothetical protein